jgi:MFS superfamily sulfate permease-like transporter
MKETIKYDISAGLVVFLVALPLCLGIALASGAPLFSGLIAGIVGGLIVAPLSGSPLSVSGPAAGLVTIVVAALHKLGNFEAFAAAVVICGVLQIFFGLLKLGFFAEFVPNSVIKGMLAAIGAIIVIKQVPYALGYVKAVENNEYVWKFLDEKIAVNQIINAMLNINVTACAIFVVSLLTIIIWEKKIIRTFATLQYIPGALIAVVLGVMINQGIHFFVPGFGLSEGQGVLVSIPIIKSIHSAREIFLFPDFTFLFDIKIYMIAGTLALVASIETLLSVEAADKIDPEARISNTNKELLAQGVGNIVAGFLGGLPITSVIVRSSANVYAGGRTGFSAFFHGILLLLSMVFIPGLLNMIPLASLAAILIIVGVKLSNPQLFISMYQRGLQQFIPFIITFVAIVGTDLLTGVIIGFIVGIFYVLKTNHHKAITLVHEGNKYLMRLNKDMSFIHKAELKKMLLSLENSIHLIIDGSMCTHIDDDITEILQDFRKSALLKDINVEFKNMRYFV